MLTVYQAQTEIMKWLRSLGHQTQEDDPVLRSCVMKRRYSCEPTTRMDQCAYACQHCGGWHIATRR